MKLHFSINKLILTREDEEILVSYSKNFIQCVFKCKNIWEDIYKYALFTSSSNEQYVVELGLGRHVKCTVPEEVKNGCEVVVKSEDAGL